jgi:hypothetical protein
VAVPDEPVGQAAVRIVAHRIGGLPVVDHGRGSQVVSALLGRRNHLRRRSRGGDPLDRGRHLRGLAALRVPELLVRSIGVGVGLGAVDPPVDMGYCDQLLSLDLRDNPLKARNGDYVEVRAAGRECRGLSAGAPEASASTCVTPTGLTAAACAFRHCARGTFTPAYREPCAPG